MQLSKSRKCLTLRSGLISALASLIFSTAMAQTSSRLTTDGFRDFDQKTWDLNWSLKLTAEGLDEGYDQEEQAGTSRLFESRLNSGFNYWLSNQASFDLQPTLKFQSGRIQSLDASEKPSNSVGVRQAALHWLPSNYFLASAGALNQRSLHSPLVSDELPFPGLRLTLKSSLSSYDLRLIGESSIPASNSLQTGTTEVESNPIKNAVQAQVNWQPRPYVFSKNRMGFFSYQNLPREVAEASSLLGNSTTRNNTEEYAFVYKYQGLEAQSLWQIPLNGKWEFSADLAGAQNQAAPNGYNSAYSLGAGLKWYLNSRYDARLFSRYFRIEPDVAPAYYSNKANIRTNRIGYQTEAWLHFRKDRYSVGLNYEEAQVIYESLGQSRARFYQIILETDYANL